MQVRHHLYAFSVLAALSLVGVAQAQNGCAGRVGVQYGQSLSSIATQCGTNVEALKALNPGVNEHTVRDGIQINVPPPALQYRQQPFLPQVPSSSGHLALPQPHSEADEPADPSRQTYVVRRGDTLSEIAASLGVPTARLKAANPDAAPRQLAVGSRIVVPTP